MKTHIMSCLSDGTVRCLWTDALPLPELGSVNVERASTIEFNNATKLWELTIDGKVVHSNAHRDSCIAWEVAHIQSNL